MGSSRPLHWIDTPEVRLFARLRPADKNGCITWTGPTTHNGYGHFRVAKKRVRAHRFAYELAKGPIAAGMQVDHLCRNRLCCNPDHLELVTSAENTRRGNSPSAISARTGLCQRGHVMDEANTIIIGSKRGRTCRQCHAVWRAAWKVRPQNSGARP